MTIVTPISSSPVTIPTSAAYPLGVNSITGITSEKSKSIFTDLSQLGESSIFQNPVADVISGFGTNISSIYNTVNNSTCLSGGEKTSLLGAIGTSGQSGSLTEALERFNTHTRTLSGLISSPGANNPTASLDRILSVGKSMTSLSYAIDSAANCFNVLNGMTGLFSGETLNGYANEIVGMIDQINSCLADVNAILSRINEMKNTLDGIINADNNFFNDALNQLKRAAISSLLQSAYSDPCGKFLLDNKIGTSRLLNTLR